MINVEQERGTPPIFVLGCSKKARPICIKAQVQCYKFPRLDHFFPQKEQKWSGHVRPVSSSSKVRKKSNHCAKNHVW